MQRARPGRRLGAVRFPSFATPIALSGRVRFGALTDTALVVDLKAYKAFGRTVMG